MSKQILKKIDMPLQKPEHLPIAEAIFKHCWFGAKFLHPYHSDWLYSGHNLAKVILDETKIEVTGCLGEWPSGLRRCCKNQKVPGWSPTRHSAGLRDPISLWGSWWPLGWKCKMQWLTSGEWGCPLYNGPKLTVGQSNSS